MRYYQQAFSLAEVLIVLALSGVLAVLAFNLLLRSNTTSSKWGRVAYDYVTHLESACNSVKLSYGSGPLNARKISSSLVGNHQYEYVHTTDSTEDPDGYQAAAYTIQCALHTASATTDGISNTYVCNTGYRGMNVFLPTWENNIKSYTGPARLEYPNSIVLYTKPDEATVSDPNNEIPNDGDDNTPASFAYDDIMDTTDDRSWVLLDMNGSALPNSIGANGDRVLLYIDDDACKVLTARQQCKLVNSSGVCNDTSITTYPQSFLDVYKNYCSDFLSAHCPFP